MLSGELGVSQVLTGALVCRWRYMDFSEVVVFMTVAKYTSRTSILGLSGGKSVSPCEVMLQVAGMSSPP